VRPTGWPTGSPRAAAVIGQAEHFPGPSRPDVIETLDAEGSAARDHLHLLAVGCDAAVKQCLRSSLRLTTDGERARIAEVVDRRCADLSESDLVVLGYHEWRDGLLRGLAAHHAGMLPVFRHTVEELFTRGLVKAVFATETLALGINIASQDGRSGAVGEVRRRAARSVDAWRVHPADGRAGRRGIDVEGHAVCSGRRRGPRRGWPVLPSTRTFPLRQLVRTVLQHDDQPGEPDGADAGAPAPRTIVRAVPGGPLGGRLVRAIERGERMLDEIAADLGGRDAPILEYARLRAAISQRRRRSRGRRGCSAGRRANDALSSLRRGDIVNIANGRRAAWPSCSSPPATTTTPAARADRKPLGGTYFVGRLLGRIGEGGLDDAAEARRAPSAAGAPRPCVGAAVGDGRAGGPKGRRSGPPVTTTSTPNWPACASSCAPRRPPPADREENARLAERYLRIERDNDRFSRRWPRRRTRWARTFDRIVRTAHRARVHHRDVDGDPKVTDDGRLLARIYSESDLLVAECLRSGVWDGLTSAELAGVMSAVLYESRGDAPGTPQAADIPTGSCARALADTRRISAELRADEQLHRISPSREPDEGFVTAVYRWATTGDLAAALDASDIGRTGSPLSAGDFVRWCRQVLDLADQVRNAAPSAELRAAAKRAINEIRRGVVAVDAM
jgi:ATP-dependent RNA helicase HelY